MRRATVAMIIGTLFCIPESGYAAMPAGVPGAWCDAASPSNCYTHADGDGYLERVVQADQWGYIKVATGQRSNSSQALACTTVAYPPMTASTSGGCNAMRGDAISHQYSRKHQYNWRDSWIDAWFIVLRFDDGVTIAHPGYNSWVSIRQDLNHPQCGYAFENPYTMIVNFEQVPKPDAPAEYVAYCYPNLTGGTTTPTPTGDPDETSPANPDPTVENAKTCPAMRVAGKGRVGVTALHANCGVAYGLLRSYLRTSRNPRGWNCISISFAKTTRAKCVRIGRARAEAVGTWRR